MRKSLTFTVIFAVLTSLFVAPLEAQTEADTTEAPWVVDLMIDSTQRCTGSVLAERWILTAARCLDLGKQQANVTAFYADADGTRREVYDGLSRLRPHRYYQRQAIPPWLEDIPNADNDVGLIELIRGSIDLSVTGRAKLYAPSRPKPWSTAGANRNFVMIGWRNTDECYGVDLDGNVTRTERKQIATGLAFDEARRDAEVLVSRDYNDPSVPRCLATPGTPWLLMIGGEYLVIAVHHGVHTVWTGAPRHFAALITTKTGWLWDASRSLRREPTTGNYTAFGLSCGGGVGDPGYIECFERDGGTVVPPPPTPPCPTGRHCCEPMGDKCRRCIPDGAPCP